MPIGPAEVQDEEQEQEQECPEYPGTPDSDPDSRTCTPDAPAPLSSTLLFAVHLRSGESAASPFTLWVAGALQIWHRLHRRMTCINLLEFNQPRAA